MAPLPPVGRCIYCGDTREPLTKEHIIPYGLGGKLILPKASCDRDANITKKIEQTCLRAMFGSFRLRFNAPTRHPKDRPDKLEVYVRDLSGTVTPRSIDISEHPTVLLLPIFPPPGILADLPPTDTWEPHIWHLVNHQEGRRVVEKFGGTGLKIGPVKVMAFARMLAKIAHSYAVARMGLNEFNPLLLDLILGQTTVVTHLIGGELDPRPAINHGHYLNLQREYFANGRTFVVATIRLFANLGAPQYRVVVGEH